MNTEKRRQMLKACVAIPVIYTLPNGSALATTSSSCRADSTVIVQKNRENDLLTGPDGTVYHPSGDTYVHGQTNEIYYFDGHSTLVSGSCWTSFEASVQNFYLS